MARSRFLYTPLWFQVEQFSISVLLPLQQLMLLTRLVITGHCAVAQSFHHNKCQQVNNNIIHVWLD